MPMNSSYIFLLEQTYVKLIAQLQGLFRNKVKRYLILHLFMHLEWQDYPE